MALLGSQGIVVKCAAAIFNRMVDCPWPFSYSPQALLILSNNPQGDYSAIFTSTLANNIVKYLVLINVCVH